MKRSGDRAIGKSVDRNDNLTAETRKRGEEQQQNLTTEARRHGEEGRSRHQEIARGRGINLPWRFQTACKTFRAVLREIFDESAYDRFLLRTQCQHSVESYRVFMIERDAAAVTKQRCC
jgi:IS5 family transposase